MIVQLLGAHKMSQRRQADSKGLFEDSWARAHHQVLMLKVLCLALLVVGKSKLLAKGHDAPWVETSQVDVGM